MREEPDEVHWYHRGPIDKYDSRPYGFRPKGLIDRGVERMEQSELFPDINLKKTIEDYSKIRAGETVVVNGIVYSGSGSKDAKSFMGYLIDSGLSGQNVLDASRLMDKIIDGL